MASASALAGAFTTLGVSANRAAAKKTNVVAKKVRVLEMPSVPNESTRTSTSSFPRVARARAHAPGDLRGSRVRREPDRRVIDAARAIARRARFGRGRPRSVRVSRLFSSPTGQFPRGVCQPAAPRTLADPASSPRSIHRLSPRARRSAPSSVISRYVSASRREPPEPPSTSTRYVFATWCPVSLPRRTGRWLLGGAFEPPRRGTRARRRSHARRLGEGNRASPRPCRSGVARGSRGRAPPPSPACSR